MKKYTLFSLAIIIASTLVAATTHASANPNHITPLQLATSRTNHAGAVRLSAQEADYFAQQGVSAVLVIRTTPSRLRPKTNKPHSTKRQQPRSYSKPDYNCY